MRFRHIMICVTNDFKLYLTLLKNVFVYIFAKFVYMKKIYCELNRDDSQGGPRKYHDIYL